MYSHNLHHVKGSRSLDATNSDNNSNKVTNMKQQQVTNGVKDQHPHHHTHHHHSNSSTASITSSITGGSKKSLFEKEYSMPQTHQHLKTNIAGTPIFIDKKRQQSTRFLKSLHQHYQGVPEPGRSKSWPYLLYMINGFRNLVLTFYFNWSTLFTAPISSFAFITVYPISVIFLVLFEFGLKSFMEKWGGAQVIRYISLKYGQGFGAINWGAPELLLSDSSAQLVQSTLTTLGLPATPITVSGCRRRTFDISIAQTFVLLSSLIYERDTDKVKEAYNLYSGSQKLYENDPAGMLEMETKMKELLWESENRIRQIAESWGLHFAGVSEFKSLGGPFCGIFWSETESFIVVAFKGTTPTNYEEFLVDATFQRTDARSFLFGCVHEGFYESLFSTTGFGNQDVRDPYGAILAAVHSKATQIQEQLNTTEPVQIYIAGHSLGAAIGSLLFARWMKCPSDLSRRCVLRDAYMIGTPAVGDNDFASSFSSYSNLPVTRASTLFRIINQEDIFCRLPPGWDSKTCGHFISESDFFNYSHIGHAIKIQHKWHSKPLKTYPSSYQPPMQVNIVTHANAHTGGSLYSSAPHKRSSSITSVTSGMNKLPSLPTNLPKWAKFVMDRPWLQLKTNPIYFIEKMYPFFLMDHIPSRYFEGLARARIYYENEELELMTESLAIY